MRATNGSTLHPVFTGSSTTRNGGRGTVLDQRGFTLVELLIALVLTSVMFSAMLVVFQTQTRINTVEADVIEAQQNARVAMTALAQDIRQSGYFVDQFNRQPIWLDAAPYQLVFNANLSDRFVAMHRDSAVPLSDGTMYKPGDFTSAPQEENLPSFLDRYLNESETIRLTLDNTYDGQITAADRQVGAANPNLYTLTKEINGNPPAVLGYNVRGPNPYPDGTLPTPMFEYWGTFTSPSVLELWGDTNGDGRLSSSEVTALTPVPVASLPEIRQVDVTIMVETNRPDRNFVGPGSTSSQNYPYRSYVLRQRIRARNVGINPTGLVLCGNRPDPPLNPVGYDTPYDQGGSITLEWDSSPDEYSGENDVQYYSVYRGISGEYEVIGQLQAMGVDTTYIFEDDGDIDNFNAPVDGTGYYYYMAAWDCAPQESIPSVVIGPIVSLPNGPAPPVITDAWDTPCDTGGDVTVQFTRSAQDDGTTSGVAWYLVYRGTVSDSTIISKVLVDTLAATGASIYHYHDTIGNAAGLPPVDGTSYWYVLRAEQGNVPSENSNEYGAVWSGSGLSAPRLLSVEDRPADDGTALILTWRRSASEDCSPSPTTYRIYRRVEGTTTWNAVTDVTVAFQNYYEYTDDDGGSGLINGTTYEYTIGVRTTGEEERSNIMAGTPRDNPPVAAPEHLVAEDVPCESDGDIRLTWQRSPDDGAGAYTADEYFVYRKVEGGTYSLIYTTAATGAASYAWTDADSTNPGYAPVLGFTYWYKVTAYDSDSSSESPPSNEDDALSDGSPGAPEITAAYDTYGAGSRQIRIEFTASVDDGGCADSVTQYRIFRTTSPGSYGTYIATVTATDAASYTYDDNMTNTPVGGPLDGFSYYYMIRAYDAVNIEESQDSNEFGPVEPYGASCDCCPIFVDDMEVGNLGWTHGGSRDDWELGSPQGKSFDPSLAHSGGNVWGTDLGYGSADGQYRARADYYLISPTLDFSAFEEGYIIMSYWRWLSVETAQKDQARVQLNNGSGWQTIWQNTQNDNTTDTEWKLQYLDLSQLVLGSSDVRIAFTLETNRSAQFGGWNLDDIEICYTAPGACDYFFYVGDSIAQSQGNNLFFDITNGYEGAVSMLGMELTWGSETSLLKRIRTQAGGPGEVWTTAVAEPTPLEAIFHTPVDFAAGETITFKLEYQPGHMRGSAMSIRFITACGRSTEIVVQVPE